MGYFDGLTQSAFNKDVLGRHVYFPNGKLGKGYVMETDAEYEDFLSFHKKRLIVMLALPLLLVVTGMSYAIIIGVFAVLALGDWLVTRHKTRNLISSDIKFSVKEASDRASLAFGLPVLVGLGLVSLCMFLFFSFAFIGSLLMPDRQTSIVLTSGLMAVFGFAMCWLFGRKIRIAWRARKA